MTGLLRILTAAVVIAAFLAVIAVGISPPSTMIADNTPQPPTATARHAPDGHTTSHNNNYSRLNKHEKKWCAVPWQGVWCLPAYAIHAYYASQSTARHFPKHAGHNDTADAFRHCYWSARMAVHMGESIATGFGDRHEMTPSQPPDEKSMDMINNAHGRKAAAKVGGGWWTASRYEKVERICLDWANDGTLQLSP